MLAVAPPSEARIVYTPANVGIGRHESYSLDFNHDGITDVTIGQNSFFYHLVHHNFLQANPGASDAVVRTASDDYDYDAALPRGPEIGSRRAFIGIGIMAGSNYPVGGHRFYFGQWANLPNGYLGVKFMIKGKTHFGWARFQNSSPRGTILKGYAYETIPGKPIKAGQTKGTDDPTNENLGPNASLANPIPATPHPASLGALALGAQGMPLWRRKESNDSLGVPAVAN
jgi:hypothetical protein